MSQIAVRCSQRFESPLVRTDLKSHDSNRKAKSHANRCYAFNAFSLTLQSSPSSISLLVFVFRFPFFFFVFVCVWFPFVSKDLRCAAKRKAIVFFFGGGGGGPLLFSKKARVGGSGLSFKIGFKSHDLIRQQFESLAGRSNRAHRDIYGFGARVFGSL